MMKKRGFMAIFLGLMAILYVEHEVSSARRRALEQGFLGAYEYGSAASSLSARLRMIVQLGFVLIVGGIGIRIVDYQLWKNRKKS